MGAINLTLQKGATFKVRAFYKDPAGVAIDLSDFSARMQIREDYESEEPLVELTTENGRITLGGETGQIDLMIDAETTAEMPAGKAVYDLELVSAGGVVERVLEGKVKITPEVTR